MSSSPLAHWVLGDLRVTVGPPADGEPWCLHVDVTRPATGEQECMLWNATTPDKLVRRQAGGAVGLAVVPPHREPALTIIADQGVGDVIQFWRYVKPVIGRFERVHVQCRPELHRLLRAQAPQLDIVTPEQADADPATPHVRLLRLDALVPDPTDGAPYMTTGHDVPPRPRSPGRHLAAGRLRVGLNWSANANGAANAVKSIPADLLEPLVRAHPDIDWVSVQWGEDERALARRPWAAGIERLGHAIGDVADLAAAVAGLDLLITIDSAPAHVAGALGVPVWTLLGRPCAWRWGLDRATTPLYGSMRLLRQSTPGDWRPVLAAASRRLMAMGPAATDAPWEDSGAPADGLSGAAGLHPCSLAELLRACRERADLRAAFVARPLDLLATAGVALSGRDHPGLAALFTAMVECHGGFSWCTPLPAPEAVADSTRDRPAAPAMAAAV